MKKLLYILTVALLLLGCRTELEYNGPEGEPSLYVYALFDNDSVNYVFVGETSFFLDNPKRDCLKDAEVTINVNGGEAVTLRYDADTALYVYAMHFETGDTLRMTVKHPRLGDAEAIAIVPPVVDVAVKEIRMDEPGKVYDNYAMIEFSTADCRETDGKYFTFEPYITAEIYWEVYDEEHYDPKTDQYGKEWQEIEYWCAYSSEFRMLAAASSVEEEVDIWNIIYGGDDFMPYQFEMKDDKVECKVEISADYWMMEYADSVRNVGFHVLMDVYSKEYVEFRQQSDKARSETNNPFVEPTQVKGNVKPTGETRYAFGCFSVSRLSGTSGTTR